MTIQGRSPALYPPIANRLRVSKDDTFDLRKMGLTETVFLCRYFLTKFFIRKESLEPFEEIALIYLCQRVKEISDPNLISRMSLKWFKLQEAIRIFEKGDALSSSVREARLRCLQNGTNVFISPRAFLGKEIPTEKTLFRVTNRRLWRRPPPLAYIGVGYRDKGNARKRYLDGSPSWQEIAQTGKSMERKLHSLTSIKTESGTYFLHRSDMAIRWS